MNFEWCLRPKLRDKVATLEIGDFAKLANNVRIVKETLKACKAKSVKRSEKRGFSESLKGKEG